MKRLNLMPTAIALSIMLLFSSQTVYAQAKSEGNEQNQGWTAKLEKEYDKKELWFDLLDALLENEMHYGAMAAAHRMLTYFEVVDAKNKAYRAIISLIDEGYPFSVRRYFVTGDLTPDKEYEFSNSYHFYKGLVNYQEGMEKWAKNYFSLVDKEHYPKYLFFEAINAYRDKDFKKAKEFLFKIIKSETEKSDESFINKAVRTLARIYFEEKRYDKALGIYTDYLLKVNPRQPEDYLEVAWIYYHLEQNDKALGALYNLTSKSSPVRDHLEQYVLRALIYREKCMEEAVQRLADRFDYKYKSALEGIKQGKALKQFDILDQVFVIENQEYFQNIYTLGELKRERAGISRLPSHVRDVAEFLYDTEIVKYKRLVLLEEDLASQRAARELLIMSESLKFLTFDVRREKYNPDKVFIEALEGQDKNLVNDIGDNKYEIRWIQTGDFWRDERNSLRGKLVDQCGKI